MAVSHTGILKAAFDQHATDAQCRRIAAWSLALERVSGASANRAPEILEMAESLDTYFGWEPFAAADDETDAIAAAALSCLRVAGEDDLDNAIRNLPVFPLAAQRALALILGPEWDARDLETIAGTDQTLAAYILRAANSAAFPTLQPIVNIPQAIMHLGSDRAARVLYAAAMQPMFATPGLRDLWHHSTASAEVAKELARSSRHVDPKKAFLAGLVHDIGVLAMRSFPAQFQDLYRRLTSLGCEPIQAERALSGISHAQAGARAVAAWKFPVEFADAIEHHHAPERSGAPLASLLYLTEQWTDSCEDAPSIARFRFALKRLALTERQFEHLAPAVGEL